jgi:hypothetical protein
MSGIQFRNNWAVFFCFFSYSCFYHLHVVVMILMIQAVLK